MVIIEVASEQHFMMSTPTTAATATICPEVIIFSPSDAHLSATSIMKSTRVQMKRKFSFPASLHSSTLLSTESSASGVIARSRRLSANVSDRVSERVRKLSTAMGLGWNHSPSKEILLSQAKFLITLYIRFRLKRSVTLNQQKKKLGLQKIQRSMLGVGDVKEVFLAIKEACTCLEQMHSKVYTNIPRQVTSSPGIGVENPEETIIILGTIGKFLFKSEITWGKIVSLFCVTGSLATDLVRFNQEEYLPKIIDAFCGVVEDELIPWLSEQNQGWSQLHQKLLNKKRSIECSIHTACSIILFFIIVLFFFINNYLLKF